MQVLGIEGYFKAIIYTEQLGREYWKPSPVGFEKLLAQLDAQPKNSVYVADNEIKDFIAPNKLGFSTIQLRRPDGIHTQSSTEPDATAKHVISEISQLPGLLQRL